MSLAESMESAAAEALKGILPAEEPTPAAEPVEPVPTPEATEAPVEETELQEKAPEEDTPEPEPEPKPEDGYAKVPVITDKLATEFTLRDADGEVEVPDLVVEYKANGKMRKDRLDQVVKLAQFGVYNEERERKVQAAEEQVRSLADEKESLRRTLDEREAQLERILQDEDFLVAVRDAYQQENSPESRAKRAEQEAKALRVEREYAPIFAENERFNDTEVIPALNMLVQALPTVTMEEMEQKLAYAALANAETAPTGDRYIPTSRFDAIRKYIVEDLAVWAQMQHARRTDAKRPSPDVATAKADADKARVEAQKAKRLVGQATKPVGSANGKVAPPKARPAANVDEAMQQAEAEVLASIGLR